MFHGHVFYLGNSLGCLDKVEARKIIKSQHGSLSVSLTNSSLTHFVGNYWESSLHSLPENVIPVHVNFLRECVATQKLIHSSNYPLPRATSDLERQPSSFSEQNNQSTNQYHSIIEEEEEEKKKKHQEQLRKMEEKLEKKKQKKELIRQKRLENAEQQRPKTTTENSSLPNSSNEVSFNLNLPLTQVSDSNLNHDSNQFLSYKDILLSTPADENKLYVDNDKGRKLFVGKIRFTDLTNKRNSSILIEQRKEIFKQIFLSFGPLETINWFCEKQHCFVIYCHLTDAEAAINKLSEYDHRKAIIQDHNKRTKNSPAVPKANFYVRWPKGVNKAM